MTEQEKTRRGKKKSEENSEENSTELSTPSGPPSEVNKELEDMLAEHDANIIQKSNTSRDLTKEQVLKIIQRLQTFKNVGIKTVVNALATLFRRGAANAGASDSLKVDVRCPETDTITEINRYDIVMAMQQVVNHKNVRKLAEAMAPEMISANLRLIKKNPLLDLKGDLANRINRKLHIRNEPALTREEEVCCCTYSQWMPNLNELTGSKRLKGLLEEDLNARRKQNAKRKKK